MLLAGVVGNIATLPGQTNGVSPFTDFLLGALPISRSQLSLAYLAGTIFSALAMPAVFLPATLVAVAVQAFGSVVSDYVRLRSFAVLHMAGVLMMMISSLALDPGFSYWLLVFGLGLNTAMMGINGVVVWPRFFGLAHLGRISGESFVWMVAGSAFGPYAYSLSEAFFGSYDAAVRIFACVAAVLLALSWFAHNPNALAARKRAGEECPSSR
jgi:hypothetical protein